MPKFWSRKSMPNFLVTFSSLFSCTFDSNEITSQGLGCLTAISNRPLYIYIYIYIYIEKAKEIYSVKDSKHHVVRKNKKNKKSFTKIDNKNHNTTVPNTKAKNK